MKITGREPRRSVIKFMVAGREAMNKKNDGNACEDDSNTSWHLWRAYYVPGIFLSTSHGRVYLMSPISTRWALVLKTCSRGGSRGIRKLAGCPGHRSYVAGLGPQGTGPRGQAPKALRGGQSHPRSHEQGLLRSNASTKAESKLHACFIPRLLRALTTLE